MSITLGRPRPRAARRPDALSSHAMAVACWCRVYGAKSIAISAIGRPSIVLDRRPRGLVDTFAIASTDPGHAYALYAGVRLSWPLHPATPRRSRT